VDQRQLLNIWTSCDASDGFAVKEEKESHGSSARPQGKSTKGWIHSWSAPEAPGLIARTDKLTAGEALKPPRHFARQDRDTARAKVHGIAVRPTINKEDVKIDAVARLALRSRAREGAYDAIIARQERTDTNRCTCPTARARCSEGHSHLCQTVAHGSGESRAILASIEFTELTPAARSTPRITAALRPIRPPSSPPSRRRSSSRRASADEPVTIRAIRVADPGPRFALIGGAEVKLTLSIELQRATTHGSSHTDSSAHGRHHVALRRAHRARLA
jgi:hypothetical protein